MGKPMILAETCEIFGCLLRFNPFTKHDEDEARRDNEDEGDRTEEEGS